MRYIFSLLKGLFSTSKLQLFIRRNLNQAKEKSLLFFLSFTGPHPVHVKNDTLSSVLIYNNLKNSWFLPGDHFPLCNLLHLWRPHNFWWMLLLGVGYVRLWWCKCCLAPVNLQCAVRRSWQHLLGRQQTFFPPLIVCVSVNVFVSDLLNSAVGNCYTVLVVLLWDDVICNGK